MDALTSPENLTMHARWFRHRGAPKPCAVILHGHDHLTLFDYLLGRRVSAHGLMGMSLGGYTSSA